MYQMYPTFKFYNINTTSAGVQIVTGTGVLHSVNINTPLPSQVVTIYDGTSTSGAMIALITCVSTTNPIPPAIYDVRYAKGLYMITTTGAANVTVAYI